VRRALAGGEVGPPWQRGPRAGPSHVGVVACTGKARAAVLLHTMGAVVQMGHASRAQVGDTHGVGMAVEAVGDRK
jgi:hypothetical protein